MIKKILHAPYLPETDSTIRYMREEVPENNYFMTIVRAGFQTAGRGQGTNTWESERDKNILCSIRVHPQGLPANRQFVLLQAVALAIKDTLDRYTDGITIKWPNDIYWNDRKISGTLTECTVSRGLVTGCIIGIGVNINQQVFTGGAPNPISLCTITGRQEDVIGINGEIAQRIGHYLCKYIDKGTYRHIYELYLHSLYRRDGLHPYRDTQGTFRAAIEGIEPDGHLVLRRADGTLSRYAFKEVEFILSEE